MSKEQALMILKETRELLSDPKRWTGRSWAKDNKGNTCDPHAPYAVCWCIEGAMRKVANSGERKTKGYITAVIALRAPCLTSINDELHLLGDHTRLMKIIDDGITRLSGGRLRLDLSENRKGGGLFDENSRL